MKEHEKDILGKAIDEVKETSVPAQLPQEVVNETLRRLSQTQESYDASVRYVSAAPSPSETRLSLWSVARWAAAAAIFLVSGYVAGHLLAGPRPDIDELHDALLPSLAESLEPAIRQHVMEETRKEYQQAMVIAYIRMKDDLTEQYQADLSRFAIETFAASNTVTNERLDQLVEAVRKSHRQNRQWVAEALAELEANRREDTTEFGTALAKLGADMETRIQHTKSEIVRLLANTQTDGPIPTPKKSSEIN